MICITKDNFAAQADRMEEFRNIYEAAFPADDEREDYDTILSRIADKQTVPETYAVLETGEDGRVCAGEIADYYPGCHCLEIIYIATEETVRGKGLGETILLKGTKAIVETIGQALVKWVFFESENPFAVCPDASSPVSVKRLRFFARNGAVRVPVDYIQPPLGPQKEPSENMFLLVLPQFSNEATAIPKEEIQAFIQDFYKALRPESCNTEEREQRFDDLLKKMEERIAYVADENDLIVLDPLKEQPQLKMEKVKLCRHFELDGCGGLQKKGPEDCPSFHSYETDLMNYHHQSALPFHTHHHALLEGCKIQMPAFYSYESEGIRHFKITGKEPLKCSLSVNWSFKEENGTAVCLGHLVSETECCSELDIIRFLTHFGSTQEKYRPWNRGRIRLKIQGVDKEYDNTEKLMEDVLGVAQCKTTLRAGISEICTDNITVVDEKLREDASGWQAMKERIYCGLMLGIFDFERMNEAEIEDTMQVLIERKNVSIYLLRGHLMAMKSKKEESERVPNILISPYLLISSVALLFNELTLHRNRLLLVKEKEEDLKFRGRLAPNGRNNSSEGWLDNIKNLILSDDYFNRITSLSKCIEGIREDLSVWMMEDIFQYESERTILSAGMKRRGLENGLKLLNSDLENASRKYESYRDAYQNNIGSIESVLLLVLAVMQIITAVFHENPYWLILSTAVTIVLVVFFWLKLLRKKRRL